MYPGDSPSRWWAGGTPALAVVLPARRDALVIAAVLVAVVLALVVDPALAQQSEPAPSGGNAGKAMGELFSSWALWLIPSVAAIVGIPAMTNHDHGKVIGIVLIAMVLGAFAIMTGDDLKKLAHPVEQGLLGA